MLFRSYTNADWTAANTPLGQTGLGTTDQKIDSYGINKGPITKSIGGAVFPAYITDISTKADQGLLTFKPAGSPIGVVAGSQDFKAGFDISFIVAAESRAEFNTYWTNLKTLQGKVKPSVSAAVWSPKSVEVNVGNWINKTAYMTSIALSIDNEYPWDLDDKKPMYINVDCGFEEINGSGIYG